MSRSDGKPHVSTAFNGFTHGIYRVLDAWPLFRLYVHSCKSAEVATDHARRLAGVDPSCLYYVQDYATGETIYQSKPYEDEEGDKA